MPILAMEPCVFPPDLVSSPAQGTEAEPWWVLQTQPRAEKALARKFLRQELPFFLPTYTKRWRSKDRLRSSHLPLFPGYLFVRGASIRHDVFATNQVARMLPVPDQEGFHEDLRRIYRLMQSEIPLTPEGQLAQGARVEVVEGPLAGLEGTIMSRGKQQRFVVDVVFLSRGVSVELEPWMLRPAEFVRA